jgi:putative DNA methylase
MLLTLLLPDPGDPHCPSEFKIKAREILRPVPGRMGTTDEDLRDALLRFIGDFADWDYASNPTFLEAGRRLVKAAHGEEPPLIVDPFAGGGSIPLEALRLGCDTFASDLNPVACLILKTMLEDAPRHGPNVLADNLRSAGVEIKGAVQKNLAQLYPPDEDGASPNCLSLGSNGTLRSTKLRRGNSTCSLLLACEEGWAAKGIALLDRTAKG